MAPAQHFTPTNCATNGTNTKQSARRNNEAGKRPAFRVLIPINDLFQISSLFVGSAYGSNSDQQVSYKSPATQQQIAVVVEDYEVGD